jgi:DNA polymerase IIIc chi subunit
MLEATFIASGKNLKEALDFSAILAHKVLLGKENFIQSSKLDIFSNNIEEANQLDTILWEKQKYSMVSHNLVNNCSDEIIRIGYPGTKFNLGADAIINISPECPKNIDTYRNYYQLVIMDGGEMREKAANTWTQCKEMGLSIKFIEK